MSCPYSQSNCPEPSLPETADSCPECKHFLKRCPQCGVRGRAFANFCRSCRTALPDAKGNWLGYKGGPQRLGFNGSLLSHWEPRNWNNLEIRATGVNVRLGDSCRSLLGYDRHVIAVSQNGTIEISDPEDPSSNHRLKADGPISCEPCIERGVLYLGAPGHLTAYSLGVLSLATPRLTAIWQIPLSGTPIQALIAMDDRAYVTVTHPGGRKEVQVIEHLDRNPPQAGRVLRASSRLSWVAADPASHEVIFFSQESGGVQIHKATDSAHVGLTSHAISLPPFAEQHPIALLGGKAFGVFGDDDKLCRIDVQTAVFEHSLGIDTKLFSLSLAGAQDWDGDGVRVDSTGVSFLRSGNRESFTPIERVTKGSPVIMKGCAAILGMQDGRIRLYDLLGSPAYKEWRLTNDGEPITAIASFHNYIAAGNAKGVVKVIELRGKGAGA